MDDMHHLATRAVHAGREDLTDLGVHAVPIDLSTTYPSREMQAEAGRLDLLTTGARDDGMPVYGRVGNPTVDRFERALASLESTETAVAFASGMAALSATLLAVASAGKSHIVAVRPLYGTTDFLLESGLLGITTTFVSESEVAAAIRPDTGLVIVESPANPTLNEVDIRHLVAVCGDVPVLLDNTFATPVLQRPAELGATLVLHSGTKYLGGHGDVLAGVIACSEEFARGLRNVRYATGGMLHPLSGYLLLRGLSTLPIRMRVASENARILAQRLTDHPAVTRVFYPGFSPDRPVNQMEGGGAMVSFEVVGDPADVIGGVRMITPAVSLGSVDTLIQNPASISHHIMDPDVRHDIGISDKLLRMSVGIEHVDDIWNDLTATFAGMG
ncbi:MAG: aminotransferase class I/II-fold pyridoxal phosphate-dependent enzyme [Thermomicrobiales bacterium]|nr:aminotransferase class I/II-fold pyridoxal phosphate-dependent enzyme [Thermomicrobiales bacterium]